MEAGLPNIIGNLYGFSAPGYTTSQYRTGSFKNISNPYATGVWSNGYAAYQVDVGFDASLSSSVYGSSETVTPLSQSVLLCVKY